MHMTPMRPAGLRSRPAGRISGFTLIELMIVVAIVAILAAVAIPSYQNYVRKGNRADGRALLQAANLAQEKHRLGNAAYASATTALSGVCPTSGTCTSGQNHYSLAISGASATGYTLTANATSSMQLGDSGCTAIVLTVAGTTMSYTPSACWSK
jgi:type IV pilus assembly protein PilE